MTKVAITKVMSWGMTGFFAIGVTLTHMACNEGAYAVEVLTYDAEEDAYRLSVESIDTLTNINTMSGRATSLIGGTDMQLDYEKGEIRWNRVGRPVAFGAIKNNGIYYPEDFNSLAMATIYYNVEQAMLYFESLGMTRNMLGTLKTYYWPKISEVYESGLGQLDEFTGVDNAFYLAIDSTDRGFYILPFKDLTLVPFSMNIGVIVHEYTHAVFQHLVYDLLNSTQSEDYALGSHEAKYLLAVNEGIADIIAIAFTGDPDFMRHSIDLSYVTRDASQMILYHSSFDRNAETAHDIYFDPYEIGAFISAAMYEITRNISHIPPDDLDIPPPAARDRMAMAVFDALTKLGRNLGENGLTGFHPTAFLNTFLIGADADIVSASCRVLEARYALHIDDITECQ